MKRSAFLCSLLGFFGVAKAQQWKQCVPDKRYSSQFVSVCTNKMMPALNNQCPVCGTMAEPYKYKATYEISGCHVATGYNNKDPNTWLEECDRKKIDLGMMANIVRCKNCNAAFFQDGEEEDE